METKKVSVRNDFTPLRTLCTTTVPDPQAIFFFLALPLEKSQGIDSADTQFQIKDCSTMQRCFNLFVFLFVVQQHQK
jgi:hypothetical protein